MMSVGLISPLLAHNCRNLCAPARSRSATLSPLGYRGRPWTLKEASSLATTRSTAPPPRATRLESSTTRRGCVFRSYKGRYQLAEDLSLTNFILQRRTSSCCLILQVTAQFSRLAICRIFTRTSCCVQRARSVCVRLVVLCLVILWTTTLARQAVLVLRQKWVKLLLCLVEQERGWDLYQICFCCCYCW